MHRIITYIPFGVKNVNGRIYTTENFKNAQNQIESGIMYGELGHPDSYDTSMKNATHRVVDIDIEDDFCTVTADILDSDAGKKLKHLMSITPDCNLVLSPRGMGSPNEDGTIRNFRLFTFDLIPREESAFEKLNEQSPKGYGLPDSKESTRFSDDELGEMFFHLDDEPTHFSEL